MAEEIGGECVFKPGSYVLSYEVLDDSTSCGDGLALPDEYITVTSNGQLAGEVVVPQGCVDSPPDSDGCFVAFTRRCQNEVDGGHIEGNLSFQFDYADGSGFATYRGNLYSGTVLLDVCVVNMEATIRRR